MPVSPLEIGIKNQKFIKKPKVGILNSDWLIWFLQWQFFLLVWNSHCTRVRFTVIMSCSDELAVHWCPLLCLQRQVAKVVSGLFYCWFLLRNNTVATHLQRFTLNYVSRRFVAWDSWTHTSWQVMQRDSHMLKGVSHVHLYLWKKHEWVCSNAYTSLKNPLLVRVWPMCLSFKLHLCRLLFMQYKITWLVRIRLCKLVEIRLSC